MYLGKKNCLILNETDRRQYFVHKIYFYYIFFSQKISYKVFGTTFNLILEFINIYLVLPNSICQLILFFLQ